MLFPYVIHWEPLEKGDKMKQSKIYLKTLKIHKERIGKAKIWKKGEFKRDESGRWCFSSFQGNAQLWKKAFWGWEAKTVLQSHKAERTNNEIQSCQHLLLNVTRFQLAFSNDYALIVRVKQKQMKTQMTEAQFGITLKALA